MYDTPYVTHKPVSHKKGKAQLLREIANAEHNKKLEELKSTFLEKAKVKALAQGYKLTMHGADKWTNEIRDDFMKWLRTEGFVCEYKNDGRNYFELNVSWK